MVEDLSPELLRKRCEPGQVGCKTSEEIGPLDTIIGQERALRSLRFGLGIREPGFNIYVSGLPGTGRTTAVKRFLDEVAKDKPVPDDWCYVNNFRDPYCPRILSLPSGKAKQFQIDLHSFIEGAQREIRKAFESEEYAARKEEILKEFQSKKDELFSKINDRAQSEGFLIQMTPIGLVFIPLKNGRPMNDEAFQALEPEEREAISRKREQLQMELQATIRQVRGIEKLSANEIQKLDNQIAIYALSHLVDDLKEKYQDLPLVVSYIEEVERDILENLSQFRDEQQTQAQQNLPFMGMREHPFRKYEVNVIVDNSNLKGAPVVMELNPTYNNLFGRIEKEAQFGTLLTDFNMIRAGSLHRANGGYLVLPVEEVLRNLFSWDSLKRAIRNREIVIEEAGERLGFIATKSLRPEPIPLDVKVVLTGPPLFYHILYSYDEDFRELFKVKADFDTRMERTEESIKQYAAFVSTLCREENLKHVDSYALAKLVEHGSRLAEDQERLSTHFGEIADIIREANFYASQEGSKYINAHHVKKAIDEKFYRSNLIQERIVEMIERGTIIIDIHGEMVGQINGLSVIDMGDITFGRPNRITANVGLGREGLIDIEREAKLGGPIHTKGVLILAGFLFGRYAQDKPLSLSARLVFEQSYSGVEGDSASSAELYALLSSLSGLPIKQGIAVTGSVNQKGQVQAVGGVNEKIEGFFQVCKAIGFTGEQGVIIPESNVKNLMLNEEIVEAVKEGKFRVWPVKNIDEGIEILTGVKAGKKKDGTYEEGTVNFLVDKKLRELSDMMRRFQMEDEGRKVNED
jgi:lon-related putative ATP-dependent protease